MLVVVATESRGPLAGLVAGAAIGFLALAARNGWRRGVLVVATVGIVFVVGLKTLPLFARGPDAPTIVRRYGAMLDAKGTSAQYRAVNWQTARRASVWRTAIVAALGAAAIAGVLSMALRPAWAEVSAGCLKSASQGEG